MKIKLPMEAFLAIFLTLKLTHLIAWPWVWILAPLWINFVILLAALFLRRVAFNCWRGGERDSDKFTGPEMDTHGNGHRCWAHRIACEGQLRRIKWRVLRACWKPSART